MRLLLFIYITVCSYSVAGGTNEKIINLDVNTRNGTDQVKVSRRCDSHMTVIIIQPQSGYKIGKFVDGDKVIYEPKKSHNYKYIEVKYVKYTNEIAIVTLSYSTCFFRNAVINYFNAKSEWIKMTEEFYDFVIYRMINGYKINREIEFESFNEYLEEKSKSKVEIDISTELKEKPGLTRNQRKEGNLDVCTYKVNDKSVISNVKNGTNTIWKWEDYNFGCYEIVIYRLGKISELLTLSIKEYKSFRISYYKLGESKNLKIGNEEFDERLKELRRKKKVNEAEDKTGNNNK